MGIVEDERVSLSDYEDLHDAYKKTGQFIDDVYLRQRTLCDSLLGWLILAEFEQEWHKQQRLSPL
ncbi:MAG: hypothetical protein M1546_26020 [Chloroflexi bacterium]|nr:hypothetical protein [Chloroflexota bacterium]